MSQFRGDTTNCLNPIVAVGTKKKRLRHLREVVLTGFERLT